MHVFGFFLFPFFGCGFVLYFLPTIVALLREKHDKLSIFLAQLLFRMECDWMDRGPGLGMQE